MAVTPRYIEDKSAKINADLWALAIDKRLKELDKQLRYKEQSLFFEQMKIDVAAEEEVAAVADNEKYDVRIKRQFIVKAEEENNG